MVNSGYGNNVESALTKVWALPIIFSIEVISSTTSYKPALIVNSSIPSDPLQQLGYQVDLRVGYSE
jgi:hypothetical protein